MHKITKIGLMAAASLCAVGAAQEDFNAGAGAGPAFDPERDDFGSVIVTIDHLLELPDNTVVKTIWSTETARESLLSNLEYFGMQSLLTRGDVLDMLSQARSEGEDNAVYILEVPQSGGHLGFTNVICDISKFMDAFTSPDMGGASLKNTIMSLVAAAQNSIVAKRRAGLDLPLSAIYGQA